jgi:predicted O-methyltransferase YrrM
MIFVDAEKEGYPNYLEWSLDNLRPGGVLAAHNVFRHGAIVDLKNIDPSTEAIRSFNHRLATESRLISTVFPAGDGMAIAVKLAPHNACET